MTAAVRLIARLVIAQVITAAMAGAAFVAFAPRLLLLDHQVIAGSTPMVPWAGGALLVYSLLAPLLLTRRVRPVLRAIAMGSSAIEPADLLALYAVPARLATAGIVGALAIAMATLHPSLRPESNDLHTQLELVLLAMTMMSVAALPFYVMVRASVARVLELAPVSAASDAIEVLEASSPRVKRVRRRLFAAVVAPVGFVALGAALLVHAHLRAFDQDARESDAADLARGVLDRVKSGVEGRAQAAAEAKLRGFDVQFVPDDAQFTVVHETEGETTLTVPLQDGLVTVRFNTSRISAVTGLYLLLAIAATLIAALLGRQIGKAFAGDVALATRQVRMTGALDVIRGTRMPLEARFVSMTGLTHAIDELGTVFREFAAAQERAIDARSATERMRGLFLASMSHDLKAPLNAILGFAELLTRAQLTDAQKESVTIVEQRGRELLHLINTILDTARAEAGELSIAPEWTRVGDVVMPAVLDARDLTVGMDVQIVGEIQPGVPRILVDSPRIIQALTAVALVATRFADHGIVRIRATLPAAGERLRIDIESSGRGFQPEERDKIFDAFKHADRARRHGSLGLGPSLARTLIEMHAGNMDVETTDGGGTVFHVWLPTERMANSLQSLTPFPR